MNPGGRPRRGGEIVFRAEITNRALPTTSRRVTPDPPSRLVMRFRAMFPRKLGPRACFGPRDHAPSPFPRAAEFPPPSPTTPDEESRARDPDGRDPARIVEERPPNRPRNIPHRGTATRLEEDSPRSSSKPREGDDREGKSFRGAASPGQDRGTDVLSPPEEPLRPRAPTSRPHPVRRPPSARKGRPRTLAHCPPALGRPVRPEGPEASDAPRKKPETRLRRPPRYAAAPRYASAGGFWRWFSVVTFTFDVKDQFLSTRPRPPSEPPGRPGRPRAGPPSLTSGGRWSCTRPGEMLPWRGNHQLGHA